MPIKSQLVTNDDDGFMVEILAIRIKLKYNNIMKSHSSINPNDEIHNGCMKV